MNNHPILKSLEDVQNYINSSPELNKPSDLEKSHGWLKYLIKKNDWSRDILWRSRAKPINPEIVSIKTVDDFQKFINLHNITSYSKLKKAFPGAAFKLSRLKMADKVTYVYDPDELYGEYNNMELKDIQKLVDEKEITSMKQLSKKISFRLKNYIIYNNWEAEIKFFNRPQPEKINNSVGDFQKYIDDNGIYSAKDLSIKYPSLYKRAHKLGFINSLKFEKPLPRKWGHVNSIEDVQNEIIKNNILNSTDYFKNYSGLSRRAWIIGIPVSRLVFAEGKDKSRFKSSWEKTIFNKLNLEFKNSNIISGIFHNVTAENDCKDKKRLEFDIEILLNNNKKLFIEIQGPRHFYSYYNENNLANYLLTRKHDIIKNRWARSQEDVIGVLYFTFDPNLKDFPYYLINNVEELVSYIKELINK